MKHIVIIGNGVGGITAARHIRKQSDFRITVISAETDYFWSRTALMYIYMGHMTYEHTKPYEDFFWKKNRIDLLRAYVKSVDPKAKNLTLENGDTVAFDILILATGSRSNKFGWPGQDLAGVQGMYSYQDLQLMEENTKNIKRAVIVGGGLIGIEMAEMLQSRNIPVTFLVRENSFWDNVLPKPETTIISSHIREHGIDLRLETELKEILSDEKGRVKAVVTDKDEAILCEFVGLTAGVSPNIDFVKDSLIATNKGIKVNEYLETNYPDVYAIGDCAEHQNPMPGRRPIEQVWYTARMMGETVAATITGKRTAYKPGVWFNSAKFLDIEYQTYGYVMPEDQDHEESFVWTHEEGRKCLHFVFEKKSKALIGVNTLDMRIRHELLDQWIREEKTIREVIDQWETAHFDPEFFTRHEKEIKSHFNEKFPDMAVPLKKSNHWFQKIAGL